MAYSHICSANFNQSSNCLPSEARGRQCVPNCLIFLMFVKDHKNIHTIQTSHLNEIMFAGSLLYCAMREFKIIVHDFVDPVDLPQCITLKHKIFYIKNKGCLSGYFSEVDRTDYLNIHTLKSAFAAALTHLRHKYFILLFNSMSVAVFCQQSYFYIFDSHSRDDKGLSCPDGFCVLGSVYTLDALCDHVVQVANSSGANSEGLEPFSLHIIDFLNYADSSNPLHIGNSIIIDLKSMNYRIDTNKCLKQVQNETSCSLNQMSSEQQKLQVSTENHCVSACLVNVKSNLNVDSPGLIVSHVEQGATQNKLCHVGSTLNSEIANFNVTGTSNCHKRVKSSTSLHLWSKRKKIKSYLPFIDDLNVPVNHNAESVGSIINQEEEKTSSFDYEIFRKLVMNGPDYVCSCCTQTFFQHSVSDVAKVQKATLKQMQKYLTGICSVNNKEWVCRSCVKAAAKGNVPQFWVNNGLKFPDKPEELNLSDLEERLVSPRLPFMQLREMPRGGQVNLKGNIVNVPADVTSTIKTLPRMISDTETIMVKLKRKLAYKHHVAFENIRPNKVFAAAKWLVSNSPVFRSEGVVVDDGWLHRTENSTFLSCEPEENNSNEAYDQEEDNWTETENFSDRPNGNQDTFLQSVDFREFNQVLSLAPGENSSPLGLIQDIQAEVLSFPTIFCGVKRYENSERYVPLHYSSICKWELRNVDRRVALNVPNIFFKLKRLQIKQLCDKVSLAIRKCKVNKKKYTAGEILTPGFVENITLQNDGYRILRNIRGSPPYWEQAKRDVFAMIRQLGIPTWFCSFSAAETKWFPLLSSLSKLVNGKDISEAEAQHLTWQEKSFLIKSDPVTCARYFDFRVQAFIKHVLLSKESPVGCIADYFYRVEFQQRGSPHIHMLIWIKDAPIYGKSENVEIARFIDKYVTCATDDSISEFVNYQTHRHAKTCRTRGKPVCRFNFPLPPILETIILEPLSNETDQDRKKYERIMDKVYEAINGKNDVTFSDLLQDLKITYETYVLAVRSQLSSPKVFIKRTVSECRINNYNTTLMKTWQANMDIQFVLDPYACVSYIVSYISKGQRGLSNLLHEACSQARKCGSDIRQQVRRIGNQFLSNVEIGAQEAVYLVLQMPLRRATREVIFLDTQKPEKRTTLIKSFSDLKDLPSNSTDTETDSCIKRYKRRPKHMESLCYAEFASWFELCPSSRKKSTHSDVSMPELPESEYELDDVDNIDFDRRESNSKTIIFACGTRMRKRTKQKVIYSHVTAINCNREEHFREKLMLYYNWRNEERDLLEGSESFESSYNAKYDVVLGNQNKFESCCFENTSIDNATEVDDFLDSICVNPSVQHDDLIDSEEIGLMQEQMYFDPNNSQGYEYDVGHDIGIQRTDVQEILPNKEIPNEQYLSLVRNLNNEQKDIFYHILHLVKTCTTPFYTYLSGGAGVGKSVTIRCIYQALIKYFGHQKDLQPDKIQVLLCAPTGKAAHNIGGNTIHSAFCIPVSQGFQFKPLDMQQLNTMRALYLELKVVIIDEISMVGRGMFNFINLRLQEVMGSVRPFGGISILAVGDLFQLKPVMDAWLFSEVYQSIHMNCIATNLWIELFDFFELKQVMRQKDDTSFALLLNRLREGKHTVEDLDVLSGRNLTNFNRDESTFKAMPHLFSTRKDVSTHNLSILNELPSERKIVIEAIDTVSGDISVKLRETIISKIPTDPSKTMGLETKLTLGCDLPAELALNVNVVDGLTNGAACVIKRFDYRIVNCNRCSIVWVQFEDESIGKQWKQNYKHLFKEGIDSFWVPIFEVTRKFTCQYYKTYLIVRRQFPLRMSSGKTIHKSQGSTMKSVVISFGNRRIDHIHYVALSRVTNMNMLYHTGINPDKICISEAVLWEMERLRSSKRLLNSVPSLDECSDNHFTLCFQNCRSLRKHIKDISTESNLLKADVVAFVETRVSELESNDFQLEGFYMKLSSMDKCSHGIACYSRNARLLENTCFATLCGVECAFVQQQNNLILAFVYCPPKRATLQNLKAFFLQLYRRYGGSNRVIVLGDFNLDPCKYKDPSDAQQFYPFTRILLAVSTDFGSCLDHVYVTANSFDILKTGTLESYYSDHKPIFVTYKS